MNIEQTSIESVTYYVYILSNRHDTVLYIGITNDLRRRISEHLHKKGSRFTRKYNLEKLLYFEQYQQVEDAIRREKQIKGWTRAKKLHLIREENPGLLDLSDQLYE